MLLTQVGTWDSVRLPTPQQPAAPKSDISCTCNSGSACVTSLMLAAVVLADRRDPLGRVAGEVGQRVRSAAGRSHLLACRVSGVRSSLARELD